MFRFKKPWRFASKNRILLLLFSVLAVTFAYIFGLHMHLLEESYFNFHYPLEIEIGPILAQLQHGESPPVLPINEYNFRFKILNRGKCMDENKDHYEKIRLLIVIKSALNNSHRRNAIRQSWGFERRFSDVMLRRIFILGSDPTNPKVQDAIDAEAAKHGDIVQADFVDTYFNNTIKTMMSYKWIYANCPDAEFIFFSDDDMYVSIKNVLRYIRDPVNYRWNNRDLLSTEDNDDKFEDHFLSGFVFFSSPQRHLISKWYVSLEEYPFSKYPPYVTGGAYVMNFPTLRDLYHTSLYTKHFRLDDIFVGIVAKKAGIMPFHTDDIYFWKKPYDPESYRSVIASHGYDDPQELLKVWNEQKRLGSA